MKQYAIWNKTDIIYTPVGKAFTPEEWINQYGWLTNPKAVPVVSAGLINGAFCVELSQMKQMYEQQGADFSACVTNEEILEAIEEFENEMNKHSTEPSVEERTAAVLEYLAINSMPDEALEG